MKTNYTRCILLLLDGARFDVFSDLLKAHHLPNIERYIMPTGTLVKGYSSLCTTTGPAHIPFIYGTYPGSANVPGIRWFDKTRARRSIMMDSRIRSYVGPESYRMGTDVAEDYVPLYDYFSKPVCILSSLDKNYKTGIRSRKLHRLQKALYYTFAHYTNMWKLVDYTAAQSVRKHIKRENDFIFSIFPAIDELTHRHHPFHPEVLKQYCRTDGLVGEIFDGLSLERTLVFIVSDHGLSATHTHVSMVNLSIEEGYTPIFYPKILRRDYDMAIMESGNATAFIYFMKPVDNRPALYKEIITIDRNRRFVHRLLSHDGIDFIAYRIDGSCIGVRSRHGESILDFGQDGYLRLANTGGNPLKLKTHRDEIPINESAKLTMKGYYPDSVTQLKQLFSSDRTGDLVVFAKEGFDLRERYEWPEHRSSHGSLAKSHMEVPICTNIRLQSRSCRTVDVFPTILHRLGYEIPDNINGQVME
jgi:predicted AlkP superfamily pyrophosphatase or phosphodiesterase